MKNFVYKIATAIGFLCFFCSTDDSVDRIEINSNQVKDYFYDETSNKVYKYVEKWYLVSTHNEVTINFVDFKNLRLESCSTEDNKIPKIEKNHEDEKGPSVTIPHRFIVTGTWFCDIWFENKTNFIHFRLRTKDTMPPQQILVNHIDLTLEKGKDIYTAKYFYQDGETVDVDCISTDETCTVQMSNPFSNMTKDDNCSTSAWGCGFSDKLYSNANQTKTQCISVCLGISGFTTVEVTFVLREELNENTDGINVKINHQDITRNMENTSMGIHVHYAYFYNTEQITITCDTNNNNNAIDISCENCENKTEKVLSNQRTEVTLVPNMIPILRCIAGVQEVVIRFQLVSCPVDHGEHNDQENNDDQNNQGRHTEDPHVDHGDHSDQENNNSGNDQNNQGRPSVQYELWIPAVLVPMLIIVVCIVVVTSKIKTRNRLNQREPEHTYDYCMVNAITPHYPAQSEIEYAVPEGEMHENTLYQRTKDFYAKVIPKSQRQRNKQQSTNAATNRSKEFLEDVGPDFLVMNSLYSSACLEPDDQSGPTKSVSDNQGTSRKASTNLELLSDVYSEPINKKETKEDTYTNVTGEPHYSNKMGGYCVYPTYSEPHIKK